jgi:hypothetical protein
MSEEVERPEKAAPVVFISYSHDSKEHKAWVAQVSARLRKNGVDVILDQWDAEPGDDLPKFMEKWVKEADRVLMVCTVSYARKVNDGKGGAGYEAMIVTGELIRDQGMNKFVPLTHEAYQEEIVPTCLSTKRAVDLSDGNFEQGFKELLETLHKVVQKNKPPLGQNPFSVDPQTDEKTRADQQSAQKFENELSEPLRALATAKELIAQQNLAAWRKFLQTVENDCTVKLMNWKTQREAAFPRTFQEKDPMPLINYVAEATSCYDALLASLLAAAESGDTRFAGLLSWVDTVWQPKGWPRSGMTFFTELPRTILYSLHSSVGAMLMQSGAGAEAVRLATTPVRNVFKNGEATPLYLSTDVTGWTETLQHHCTVGWKFLRTISDNSDWLTKAFGSEANVQTGQASYYMLLSFLEFCRAARNPEEKFNPETWRLEVPLSFCQLPDEILRPAYQQFLCISDQLKIVLERNGVDEARLKTLWPLWMKLNNAWINNVYRWHHRWSKLPQDNLPADLFRDPYSLT